MKISRDQHREIKSTHRSKTDLEIDDVIDDEERARGTEMQR